MTSLAHLVRRPSPSSNTPEARGGPFQKTRASQLDGAAQTEAVRSNQTVIMFQPCTAVSAGPWSERKSPCVETLEVCWCEQEDRHAEGHQTSPETVSPAHDQQERGRILSSMPPGHLLESRAGAMGRLRPLQLRTDGPEDARGAGGPHDAWWPRTCCLAVHLYPWPEASFVCL